MFENQLPYLLQRSNIARIDGETLLIGDRRTYPWEQSFVPCTTVKEIAQAIRSMVTQGGGPLQVAMTTMRFLARKIYSGIEPNTISIFLEASHLLAQARPTNTTMARTVQRIVAEIGRYYVCNGMREVQGGDLVAFVDEVIDRFEASFDRDYAAMSDYGIGLLGNQEGILTTCFAEHSFILTLAKAVEQGKSITVYVPETRPYLQGARLTAPSLQELGIPTFLITDGMGAHFMREGVITQYLTAADLVAMDGTVVNKVGTLTNAINCSHYAIPYYPFAVSPDPTKASAQDIEMEERDGSEICMCNGTFITHEHVVGKYPAFDIIDPDLVTGIITPRGVVQPENVKTIYSL